MDMKEMLIELSSNMFPDDDILKNQVRDYRRELDDIPLVEIERYLREKKLERINKK
jgi:hypothetical protein